MKFKKVKYFVENMLNLYLLLFISIFFIFGSLIMSETEIILLIMTLIFSFFKTREQFQVRKNQESKKDDNNSTFIIIHFRYF